MQEYILRNILIDPSLLIKEEIFQRTLSYVKQLKEKYDYEFYLPSSFLNLIEKSSDEIAEDLLFYYKYKKHDYKYIYKFLDKFLRLIHTNFFRNEVKLFNRYKVSHEHKEKYDYFYRQLKQEVRRENISSILFEEWVFLQEQSVILSRIKKPFTYFVRCGVAVIEIGRKTFQLAIKRTLKKNIDEDITNIEKLRAIAKWIAIGGPNIISGINLIDPIVERIIYAGAGFFILIDP